MSRFGLHQLRARLADETGAAMLVAMIVVMVTGMLAAVSVTIATQTNSSTRRDANNKSALEAAEAGLQVALYRLNMLRPDDTHCIGDAVSTPTITPPAPASPWCVSSSTQLGNGTSYQYYTTPSLGGSATCVGLALTSSNTISQRCVTSVGTSNGVSARSQIRVASFQARPLFPIAGITGTSGVTLNGNANVSGSAASNGTVLANGNISLGGGVLGPAGKLTKNGNVTVGSTTRLTSPIVLSPVDPGTSNQSSLSGCLARQTAGYPACNDNYRINNYINTPSHPSPYDPLTGVGTSIYDQATRALTLNGNLTLTLGGGVYNFCQLAVNGNITINVGATAKTAIFIDSPDDPGSGCPAGTGNITLNGNVNWSNASGDPTALQIYVYGLNNGSNTVTLNGNTDFHGVIYAPQSTVNLNGNIGYYGAISGTTVNLNGNSFTWDGRAGSLQAGTTGLYYRTAWAQCTSVYSTSNPGVGCG
jgi:Tfp pilus assembly protein PilX